MNHLAGTPGVQWCPVVYPHLGFENPLAGKLPPSMPLSFSADRIKKSWRRAWTGENVPEQKEQKVKKRKLAC